MGMADTSSSSGQPHLFRGKLWFWVPIVPLLALDLWSKAAVFSFIAEHRPGNMLGREFLVFDTSPLRFSLVTWWNTGTIWGLAKDYTWVLMVLRCAALILILFFAAKLRAGARLAQFVLGLIMAGAIGNLYDNFTEEFHGVRDFLRFQGSIFGQSWEFPAFNVADSCICVGAITLAILMWRGASLTGPESSADPS